MASIDAHWHSVFHYVYAVLHHPHYRARYAENLKKSLPRIPLIGVQIALPDSPPPAPPTGEDTAKRARSDETEQKNVPQEASEEIPSQSAAQSPPSGRGRGGQSGSEGEAFAAL